MIFILLILLFLTFILLYSTRIQTSKTACRSQCLKSKVLGTIDKNTDCDEYCR